MLDGAPAPAPAGLQGGAPRLAVSVEAASFIAAGRPLIDGVSVRLDSAGVVALMGPNGAGKSLTLRLLAGLIAPHRGRVLWNGAPQPPRGRVALVFQRPVLLRRSTAANLRHALRLAGVPRREREPRLEELLALGRLQPLADAPARALSGGEQQRLALVRALACRPSLLLLDEPTASLDPPAVAAFEALLARIVSGNVGATLVTHEVGQARRLAERVLFLHRGRLVEDGPAARFFRRPDSAEGRDYLAGRILT